MRMNKSRFISVIPTSDPFYLSLVDNQSGRAIVQYRILKNADLLQNAELTKKIIAAYQEYYKSVTKRLDE